MPLINIEYDDDKVSAKDAERLANAARDIVSDATGIEDVFVYANAARIKVRVAPVEIFIRMTAKKIEDQNALFGEIRSKLAHWKTAASFPYPINLTLIPMDWMVETGI